MFSMLIIIASSVSAMLCAWIWQQTHKNAGVVDVVWAFGMMLAGPWYAFQGVAPLFLKLVLGLLTFAWFLRLGLHLARRVFSSPEEDSRYAAMRLAMGQYADSGFLGFFMLQAGFIVTLSLPFWAVAQTTEPQGLWVFFALGLALLALWGEASADQQLAAFKSLPENRGKTCREGWWRYSRHPNYFFEWLHWFAYPLMAWGEPYQYWLCLAPVLMLVFLVFLTGIPFAEQQALLHRGEDYRRYQQVTSRFVPWWPKPES